jgi:hypothetical protein
LYNPDEELISNEESAELRNAVDADIQRDRETAKRLLTHWSSDTFDDVDGNLKDRKFDRNRVRVMSALEEHASDSDGTVDKVKYLNRSISALLDYNDKTASTQSSPRAGGSSSQRSPLSPASLAQKLSKLKTTDGSSDSDELDRKKERKIRRNNMVSSAPVTPTSRHKQKGDNVSEGGSTTDDELNQVEKYRSSRSSKPAKRLSFHATPRSNKARRSFMGDLVSTEDSQVNYSGGSNVAPVSPSGNDFSTWNDFKSSDSFLTSSTSGKNGQGPVIESESCVGSGVGSQIGKDHNIIVNAHQFDMDGGASVIGEGKHRIVDGQGWNKAGGPNHHEELSAQARERLAESYDSDNVNFDKSSASNDTMDDRDIYSSALNDREGHRNSNRRSRVRKPKVKPHYLFETLKLPQAVDVAGNLASAVSQSMAATATLTAKSPNGRPSSNGKMTPAGPSGLQSPFGAFAILPDVLKSFTASSSQVNSHKKSDFKRELGNPFGRKKEKPKGMARFKFFTAKIGGNESNCSSAESAEETEHETVGDLEAFDDGEDGYYDIVYDQNNRQSPSGPSIVAEDFRDNESVAETIDSDPLVDQDGVSYYEEDDRSSHSSNSTSEDESDDSFDSLDPRNQGPSALRVTSAGRSGKANGVDGNNGLTWRTYWANFRARKYNFLSLDEEEEDRQIDNEIDNFIVPDELGSLHLQGKTATSGYVFIEDIQKSKAAHDMPTISPLQLNHKHHSQYPAMVTDPVPHISDPRPAGFKLKRSMSDMDGLIESSPRPHHAVRDNGSAESAAAIENALDFLTVEKIDSDLSDTEDYTEEAKLYLAENILPFILNHVPFHVLSVPSGGLAAVTRKSPLPHQHSSVGSLLNIVVAGKRATPAVRGLDLTTELNLESLSKSRSFDNARAYPLQSDQALRSAFDEPENSSPAVPLSPVSVNEFKVMLLSGDLRSVKKVIDEARVRVSKAEATDMLLQCVENVDSISEPLELFMLLVDNLGADPNARDGLGNSPLHSLFSKPILGRFLITRGGDILAKDSAGDSVLQLCLEYGYDWIVPAVASAGREHAILEDPQRAHEYALCLLSLGGYGIKVKEFIEDGLVTISAEEALDIMDKVQGNYENLKDPVETFELLESLILE